MRRGAALLAWILGLGLGLLARAPAAQAVAWCGGTEDTCTCGAYNPYPCCDNGGNCTWWAWHKACCIWDLGLPGWGNANTWAQYADANADFRVLSVPVIDSIACKASGSYGHVAWVTAVSGDAITVSEQNCWGNYGDRVKDYDAGHFDGGFIVPVSSCACSPDQTQAQACGDCGEQTRVCEPTCQWGAWSSCAGQGVCAAGAVESEDCGDCGARGRVCSSDCGWQPWGDCLGEGACSPGALQEEACGDCGRRERLCDTSCGWATWGACEGDPALASVCEDGNPCTDDSCDPGSGACVVAPNALACDDGDACTAGDMCAGGLCVGVDSSALACDDGDACTDDGCDPGSGCWHATNTAACDDGDACTLADQCQGGQCVAGQAKVCADGEPCTADGCDPQTGACLFEPLAGPCDDGDACTLNDACQDGSCLAGEVKACFDGLPCTTDGCDHQTGACMFEPFDGPCDDSDACTDMDHCVDGACQGVPLPLGACDDGNPCTDDACDPVTGCRSLPNDGPCDDEDPCTESACVDGACVTTAVTPGCDCAPHDSEACLDGDLWALDGCGLPEAVLEGCGGRGCLVGACCPPGTMAKGDACVGPEPDSHEGDATPDGAPDRAPDGALDVSAELAPAPDTSSAAPGGSPSSGGCGFTRGPGSRTGLTWIGSLLVLCLATWRRRRVS